MNLNKNSLVIKLKKNLFREGIYLFRAYLRNFLCPLSHGTS